MKTIKQWYIEIEDEEVREKALKNLNPIESTTFETFLSRALHQGFDWHESSEGFGFWDQFCDEILLKEGW